MKKFKAIIFDLDGTLADTLPLCIAAFRRSVEPLAGRPVTDEEIIATFGPSEEGTIRTLVPEHYDEGVSNYLKFYEMMHDQCREPFDGIVPLLDDLKNRGIKIAMVTGKGKHSTDISLKQFNLADFFEIIETGSPAGPRKVQGIQVILAQWAGLQKDEVIYVGDAPSDIQACREAGIPIAAAAWADTAYPQQLLSLHPDRVFYSVREFSSWILSQTSLPDRN